MSEHPLTLHVLSYSFLRKRNFTFSGSNSAFQPVKKIKYSPEETPKIDDEASLAKSGSICISEESVNTNISKKMRSKDKNSIRLERLMKNRESATRCRNKRKAAINNMSNEVMKTNKENDELKLQIVKCREFMDKLQKDNVDLNKKAQMVNEENRQLKLQHVIIQNSYAQVQQMIMMLYDQNRM